MESINVWNWRVVSCLVDEIWSTSMCPDLLSSKIPPLEQMSSVNPLPFYIVNRKCVFTLSITDMIESMYSINSFSFFENLSVNYKEYIKGYVAFSKNYSIEKFIKVIVQYHFFHKYKCIHELAANAGNRPKWMKTCQKQNLFTKL